VFAEKAEKSGKERRIDGDRSVFPYAVGVKTTIDIPEPLCRKAKIREAETGLIVLLPLEYSPRICQVAGCCGRG
jgi:hypothetical protein